ncbi:exosome non-catalytic core subunit rrp40 [Serendipita sp. 396]|nr:exosome non-catalytic core subunit rrp40 [Serendipita sp. 396]KAG8782421.1 exosome non-catalytic core subunit rrp40 [Serendipita sp. 397]KAG8797249.1 exosome non-catalytic core subunit rrp40 [Serendipita sp. 398]KAG8820395.1 exosome non-catalytic core subunit rrp40 [Serendipita sp. 401]KAG8865886.1 exosome non-catalytic core subunit rrp40 [Serendipita sp. 405]KAG9053562.1 exosome non-catalytic core subunit rrp40 [Serendipita sp. 407]
MASRNVLPGDIVTPKYTNNLKLGPGLHQPQAASSEGSENHKTIIVATCAGTLESKGKNKYYVEANGKRYVPAGQEPVVGVVTARMGEAYRVDIGSAHPATLDALAFEGATKRNRPNLRVGSLVYARVSLANKNLEPELECFDGQTHKSEGFGELKGGLVKKCSLGLARKLLDPDHFLLPLLGARFSLDAAIGVNGKVWFKAPTVKQTIAISRCIEAVDERSLEKAELTAFLNTLDV